MKNIGRQTEIRSHCYYLLYSIVDNLKMSGRGKEEKDLGKEARNVTEKFFVIISKVSRNLLSAGWLEEVVSSVSLG